jgi:hypothetical protein
MTTIRKALYVALVALVAIPSLALAEIDKSANVKHIVHIPFPGSPEQAVGGEGATDIDFEGDYVYAMQQGATAGGVHIIDHSARVPKEVGFVSCPATQNDVAVVKPGLIALGFHSGLCAGTAGGGGVRLVDVSNPKKGKLLGFVNTPSGSHTITTYPGKPIIYASPGGTANGGSVEQIIDVSNPKKPKIVGTFGPQQGGPAAGCHDLNFFIKGDTKVAICTGLGQVQIWDVSDPIAPAVMGAVANPSWFLNHTSDVSDDGAILVISDETEAQDCVGGPSGAFWAYDFSVPQAPTPLSHYKIQRGQAPVGTDRPTWCTSHNFNFIPGTHKIVASWYAAGMNVVSWEDPMFPTEEAYYYGTGDDTANYWSAYWYDGRIYATDRVKGLDVFEVKGLKEGK